jgi:hypothetical protein
MSMFQLDPESVAERARASGQPVEILCLGTSLQRGILGFTALSIAGFAPWAIFGRWLYRNVGEGGLYIVCALVFLGLSGPLLRRLVLGPGSLGRFYKVFCLAFSAYAVLWICGWMTLRGHIGGLVGLLAGTAVMGTILARAFDARGVTLQVITGLFVLNAIGYFGGGWVEGTVMGINSISAFGAALSKPIQGVMAKLLWGICYGIGFGAGLGFAFSVCQERARAMLKNLKNGTPGLRVDFLFTGPAQ